MLQPYGVKYVSIHICPMSLLRFYVFCGIYCHFRRRPYRKRISRRSASQACTRTTRILYYYTSIHDMTAQGQQKPPLSPSMAIHVCSD